MLAKLKSIIPTVNKCRIADFSSLNFVKRGRETYLYVCNTGHKMYAVQQRGRSKEQDYFVHVIIWIKSLKFLIYWILYSPLQYDCSEAFPTQAQPKRKSLEEFFKRARRFLWQKMQVFQSVVIKGQFFLCYSYAESVGARHFHTSAKLNKGIEELFLDLSKGCPRTHFSVYVFIVFAIIIASSSTWNL